MNSLVATEEPNGYANKKAFGVDIRNHEWFPRHQNTFVVLSAILNSIITSMEPFLKRIFYTFVRLSQDRMRLTKRINTIGGQ